MYLINGVALDERNCVVEHGSDWLAPISPTVDAVTIPGVHGIAAPVTPPVIGQRNLTIKIGCAGLDGWKDAQRILRLLAMPRLTLTRRSDEQITDRCANVILTSLSADDTTLGRYTRYTATLAMTSACWRSPDPVVQALPDDGVIMRVAATSGLSTAWLGEPNNSVSILSTDGFADGAFSDAPVDDLIIRVPGGVDSMSLTDATSWTSVSWSGKSASGYLYVDPKRLKAWTSSNSAAWTGGGADVTSGLDYGTGGPLQIWPDEHGEYKTTLSTHGVPAGQQTYLRYYRSWW